MKYKPTLDIDNPPPRLDRKAAAALLYARLGLQVSPRTLEGWPVPTKVVNGRATFVTKELLAHGQAIIDGDPGGRVGRFRKSS